MFLTIKHIYAFYFHWSYQLGYISQCTVIFKDFNSLRSLQAFVWVCRYVCVCTIDHRVGGTGAVCYVFPRDVKLLYTYAHMLCSVKCSLIHMALTAQSSVYFELHAMNIRSLVYMIPNLYTFTQYTNLIHAPDMIIHKITELSGVHDIYIPV